MNQSITQSPDNQRQEWKSDLLEFAFEPFK